MIDYDKPDDDEIVADVRRAREEIAAEFNYDLGAICEEMGRRQGTNGRKYAAIPPRHVNDVPGEPAKKVG
jgi:hypothetical protein